MARAVALTRLEKIAVEDLPQKIRGYRTSRVLVKGSDPTELGTMEEVERRYILHVLQEQSAGIVAARHPSVAPADVRRRLLERRLPKTLPLPDDEALWSEVHARACEVMLPILLFPLVMPALIASVKLTAGVLDGQSWAQMRNWLQLLIGLDIVYFVLSYLAFEFIVEE